MGVALGWSCYCFELLVEEGLANQCSLAKIQLTAFEVAVEERSAEIILCGSFLYFL